MKFKVTEDENISTVFLNGEIDMDIADNVRGNISINRLWKRGPFKHERCSIHGLIWNIGNCRE